MSSGALIKGQEIEDTKTLNLVIFESKSEETSEEISILWILIILIIIIMTFILIFFRFQKKKRQEKDKQLPSSSLETSEIEFSTQDKNIQQIPAKDSLPESEPVLSTPVLQPQIDKKPPISTNHENFKLNSSNNVIDKKLNIVFEQEISKEETEE